MLNNLHQGHAHVMLDSLLSLSECATQKAACARAEACTFLLYTSIDFNWRQKKTRLVYSALTSTAAPAKAAAATATAGKVSALGINNQNLDILLIHR